jgi:hypothetical protein
MTFAEQALHFWKDAESPADYAVILEIWKEFSVG